MIDKVIELNTSNYELDTYFDKTGNTIDLKLFFIQEREESHLTQLIVQASVENEIAGYVSLLYLSEENKNKYFKTPWDFYYNKKMSSYLKELFNNYTDSFYKEVNRCYNIDVHNIEEFKQYITTLVTTDYTKFISFHLNKPYPEIITVYSDLDKTAKDFTDFPFVNIERKKTNFLNKGIANVILHGACAVLKNQNMHLYASNNNTSDGQRLCQHLTKNSKFITLCDNYWGTLTTNRTEIVEFTRKKFTI